jgi:hypothetical protein
MKAKADPLAFLLDLNHQLAAAEKAGTPIVGPGLPPCVIARLTPAEPKSPLTVGELNAFLRSLPSLGDDADDFAQDLRAIRAELPSAN